MSRSLRSRRSNLPNRIPPPSHRHAAPSGPWPWMDLDSEQDEALPTQLLECLHGDCATCLQWLRYPQSLFPNWTPRQVLKSGITDAIQRQQSDLPCIIHLVDVLKDGTFLSRDGSVIIDEREYWASLQEERPGNVRVRLLFVENISGPILQILGTVYNIEPFFFSSSLNWIPSRYQEDVRAHTGDHITITLTFLRSSNNPDHLRRVPTQPAGPNSVFSPIWGLFHYPPAPKSTSRIIDTQAPLALDTNGKILHLDLLAVHMIRGPESSTIISYHPSPKQRSTSAGDLHSRVKYAGESVYWQNIFKESDDPTFVLLAILWHALYAWDESLEALYDHFCELESSVMETKNLDFTQELHVIRAHLLHWSSLLNDLKKSIQFITRHPNPALQKSSTGAPESKATSQDLLIKECDNMLSEIERLERSRSLQDKRVKNVMNLVFSSVNIDDSRQMKELTKATVRDSAAMKQVAYLTMFFLPASFVAAIFGMNVRNFSTDGTASLPQFFEAAVPLTALTVWILMAVQSKYFHPDPDQVSVWSRLIWPFIYIRQLFSTKRPAIPIV